MEVKFSIDLVPKDEINVNDTLHYGYRWVSKVEKEIGDLMEKMVYHVTCVSLRSINVVGKEEIWGI